MVTTSDQIQADIARTRARMSSTLDNVAAPRPGQGGASLTASISEQVRQRPLVAIGLSLLAGSLLKNALGGGGTTSSASLTSAPSYNRHEYGSSYASRGVGSAMGQAVSGAVDQVGDAAQSVGQATTQATRQVVDTAQDVAGAVAGATAGVARQVADTTGDVADQVMETAGDAAGQVRETTGDLISAISEQVRERPLVAIGVSLVAGRLLSDYLSAGSSGQSGATRSSTTSYTGYSRGSGYAAPSANASTSQRIGNAADRLGDTVSGGGRQVVDTAQDVAGAVADTTADVARGVADTTVDVARGVAGTTADVARGVADTTVDVARGVANTTADVVNQVGDTAGAVTNQLQETTSNLYSTLSYEIQERPLAALSLAVAAGMLLRPTLMPYVSSVTESTRRTVSRLGDSIGEVVALPEPDESARIKQTLVPATVEQAKQFTSRELREYLDRSLENVVGQTSLRAGVVAAITEKAEGLAEHRLPSVLERSLQGARGPILIALAGAILKARDQAQRGEGQTLQNVKTDLSQALMESSKEQLLKYFPTFREQYDKPQGQSV